MGSRSVLIRVPDEVYKDVRKLVERGKYKSIAEFFYLAGRKELDKLREVATNA